MIHLINIEQLVTEYLNELDQRNYRSSSKRIYNKVCIDILEWCKKNNIKYFNEAIGNQYCDEVIGGHLSKHGSTQHYRTTLRVVRMLVTLLQNGDFEFRSPSIEYKFETELGEISIAYLDFVTKINLF